MSMPRAMVSSASIVWETPQDFFDALDREFGFDLDVCALARNAKCARFFSPDVDGLSQPWDGACWMNPPYGREISKWMRKAHEESQRGATVVCLVPARVDARWWHDYCTEAAEIRFPKGRLWLRGVARGRALEHRGGLMRGRALRIGGSSLPDRSRRSSGKHSPRGPMGGVRPCEPEIPWGRPLSARTVKKTQGVTPKPQV